MAPISFVVVGSGFRAMFFGRIAKRFPELFEMKYMLCRTQKKAERLAREYEIPTTTSAEACVEAKPDFVIVAVNKEANCSVMKEWIAKGFAVMTETPAGATKEELKELWTLSQEHGAKIQVLEQYHRYPIMAAGLKEVKAGRLGDPYAVSLSVCHDYHGASLIRRMLGMGMEPMVLRGSHYEYPVEETDSRYGPITDGSVNQKSRDHVTIEFQSGKVAFYDFAGVQYRSFIRSRHVNVRGEKGEWNDSILRYVKEDHLPELKNIRPYLDPKYQVLETEKLREICGQWNPVLALEAEQDEYAIATMLYDMREYLAGGDEVYPLREALEDAYEWLLIQEAVSHPGETIVSEHMPWHDEEI